MNQHPRHISDALRTLGQSLSKTSPTLWLLLDPALHAPLACETDELPQTVISLPQLAQELTPRLIQIDAERDARLLQHALEIATQEISGDFDDDVHGRPRSMCAWLRPMSDAITLQTAARCLADMAKLQPPSGSEPVSLRFWDPRITPDLIELLSPSLWAGLLSRGGIAQWWFMDEAMQLKPCVPENLRPPDTAARPWQPSEAQWLRLNQISWRNRIEHLSQSWDCTAPPTQQSIDALVRRASSAGLTDESDVICFVHARLSMAPEFDLPPAVQAALQSEPTP